MERAFWLGTRAVWLLAFLIAVSSARYFLVPPPLIEPPMELLPAPLQQHPETPLVTGIAPYLYRHHGALFLPHIAAGIVALVLGLFQFIGSLRSSRPALHRLMGRVYLLAVLVVGATGLPLAFFVLDSAPEAARSRLWPLAGTFATLSVVVLVVSAMAYLRVRQRLYAEHRAWMLRSYALIFAAVTTRTVAPLLVLPLIYDPVAFATAGLMTWPLNLVVAEWLIRRRTLSVPVPAQA
jgi:uncharacterized membrane protein